MKTICIVLLLGIEGWIQTADTLRATDTLKASAAIDWLYERLLDEAENLETTALEDAPEQLEELLEVYEYYREHPVNINGDEVVRLEELGLLSPFQVEALQRYRKMYGDLLLIEELRMIEELDEPTVAVITPIVCLGKSEWVREQESLTIHKAIARARHQMTLNYARKSHADTSYLGSPDKVQLKYGYSYGTKFRMGIALEKDAGEPFFLGLLDDTLQETVRAYRKPGFDFYGAHLYMTDIPLARNPERRVKGRVLTVQNLALGDYLLSFGQGLTLWSGMRFGKASEGSSTMRRAAGIRPKASASEGQFFRGAATTLQYGDWQASVFYSLRDIDATVVEADTLNDDIDEPELVSALQETGYHRTLNELAKRHTLRQQVFGGHCCYAGSQLEVGLTAYHLCFDKALQLKPSKYNQYYFQGDRLTDMGMDFRWLVGKFAFFGELARSDNGAWAGLAGMTAQPRGYINFSLLYRNYDKRYQNLFNGAFGESSRRQGEEGCYLGLQCAPAPRWSLLAYCDYFRLTWLSSQVYTPSWGQEYSLKVSHQLSRNATMQLRFKSKNKMKNSTDDHAFSHYPIFYTKRSVQFQLSYTLFDDFVFGNKVSYSHYLNDDGIDSKGHFICQDLAYKPEGKPYSLTFRYALFDSDDYNSRISMYENDVLGAFSIPSLSGRGTRVYLLGKVKLFGCFSLYSRLGFTIFQDDTKTDLKVEVIWKG